MAYTHSKVEVVMPIHAFATAVTATGQSDQDLATATTQVISRWAPGMVPHIVRGVSVVLTVATASSISAGAVIFQHEKPVLVGTTATQIALLTFPTTMDLSTTPVLYQTVTGYVEIVPGQGVRAQMETAATAGIRGNLILYLEPRWETPANMPMIRTT